MANLLDITAAAFFLNYSVLWVNFYPEFIEDTTDGCSAFFLQSIVCWRVGWDELKPDYPSGF